MNREQIRQMLESSIETLKLQGRQTAAHMAEYGVVLAERLVATAGQPGYPQAVTAARDAYLLEAAAQAVAGADAFDTEQRGIVLGLLTAAAGVVKP